MKSKVDPGKPGLYEVHFLYSFPRDKKVYYTVILLTSNLFARAYELALIQLQISQGHRGNALQIVDNLINLITDPVAYITAR